MGVVTDGVQRDAACPHLLVLGDWRLAPRTPCPTLAGVTSVPSRLLLSGAQTSTRHSSGPKSNKSQGIAEISNSS